MFRKIAFFILFLCVALPAAAQKAGVGAWENSRHTILEWIEGVPSLGWYYNWRTDHIYSNANNRRAVEFVPMIHSAKDVNKRIVSDLPVRALLGFNEPDGRGGTHQANMSVAEAIRLWPKLQARGLRLGSPATTQPGTLGQNTWQRRFMNEVEARGLRVDFMAVHYYSTTGNIDEFRKWLTAVHAEYRRPIWVTEFALIDWKRPNRFGFEQNAVFVAQSILMMERLPFVERHAWFAANPYPWRGRPPQINLVSDNLAPTPVGKAFDRILSRVGGDRVAGLN